MPDQPLTTLTREAREELLLLLEEKKKREKYNFIKSLYPDEGTLRRDLYVKQVDFYNAGVDNIVRAMISANQTGKTMTACFELVLHLTGLYDEIAPWWKGRRYKKPIMALIGAETGDQIRDSIQKKLLGEDTTDIGTGLLPKTWNGHKIIIDLKSMEGITGGYQQYLIQHFTNGEPDGNSQAVTRTYAAGKKAFESLVLDFVMLDEKVPQDIYSEALTRIISKKGSMVLTFTPTDGYTPVVEHFMEKRLGSDEYVTQITWDDAPHLDDVYKAKLLASYAPYERECRSKGIPYLGSGKVYQVLEDDFVISPLKEIPHYWPKFYGMDIGYSHPTAIVFCAWDRDSDVIYIYSEHKLENTLPALHAQAVIQRGVWIPGIIDTTANTVNYDMTRLITVYQSFGLNLYFVKKGAGSVEEGVLEVNNRLASGRLKVYSTCTEWIREYRTYRREDGIIKKNNMTAKDDLMDATRYAIRSGLQVAGIEPDHDRDMPNYVNQSGRSEVTGY